MEKKNKRAVIVGLFVFVALVILLLGVMTLGGQNSVFNKGVVISASFDQVNGLQPGNNVWYAGVKIGTVQNISFDKEGRVRVQMKIEERFLPVIKKDAKAKVGADGFIGNKLVVLYGGSPNAPVVENGGTLNVEPAISAEEMMATLQENNKNVLTITTHFKAISERMMKGEGSMGKLLQDEQLFRELQQSVASIRLAAANAQTMAGHMADYTAQLNQKGSLTHDLVTDTVIFSRLRSTVKQIDALSLTAGQVIDNLNLASKNLESGIADTTSTVGFLLNDKETAADLRETIKNLRAGTEKLDENMEALQHNFLFRGFFRKKNKTH